MEQFYLEIRWIHIGSVIASGTLFALRALVQNLLNARWPSALPVRILSWSIDTVLLTAALMLMTIVQHFPFVDAWLTVKVMLLVAYIVIGWWAIPGGAQAGAHRQFGGRASHLHLHHHRGAYA